MKEQFEYHNSNQGIENIKQTLLKNKDSIWLTDLDDTVKEASKCTWVDGKARKVFPETIAAFRVLYKLGIQLGIVTEQSFAEMAPWLQDVAALVLDKDDASPFEVFTGHIIGEGGNVVKRAGVNERRIIAPPGALADREKLLEWLEQDGTIIPSREENWGILDNVDPQEGTLVELPKGSDQAEATLSLWEKGPHVSQDPAAVGKYDAVRRRIVEQMSHLEVTHLRDFEAGNGTARFVQKFSSKKHTVELFSAVGLINAAHVIYSCDGPNDIGLAQYLASIDGKVIAVGNAVNEVKHAATYVAAGHAGLGFAETVAKMFPDEYSHALEQVTQEALNRKPPQDNSISYEQMIAEVEAQMEKVIADPKLLHELYENIQHGPTTPKIEQLKNQQNEAFNTWINPLIAKQLAERQKDPKLAVSVKGLSPEDIVKIKTKAFMHYVVERDLVGPLIYHFASAIKTWQDNGMLPGLSVGMLRDFQPFYVAGEQLGAEVLPMYLRRALFSIGDELDTSDVVKDKAGHIAKLAYWLKPLLIATHLNLLDSGCWGTLVYEIGALRSAISWLVNANILDALDKIATEQKIEALTQLMPSELITLLNTGLSPEEVKTRWGILEVILTQEDYLSEMKALKGHILTTTGLDHYSHAWSDPRFINHQLIYSHINTLAGDLPIDPLFGELINDTIEENHASKIYKGPTKLAVDKDGSVSVVLEKNDEFGEEIAAWASCQGVKDAVTIAQKKLQAGIKVDPQETILHMYSLAQKARSEHVFTGVLPHNTPTWSHGEHFLGNIWPVLANNPYSTYKPFESKKGVISHGK